MWLQLKQPGCQDESISVVHIRYCWPGDRRVQQPPSKRDACTEESMSISISGSAITYSMILSLLDHLLHDLIIYSMILSPTPWFYHYLITYSMILSLLDHLRHDFITCSILSPTVTASSYAGERVFLQFNSPISTATQEESGGGGGYGKGRHALSFCFFTSTACPHRYTTG